MKHKPPERPLTAYEKRLWEEITKDITPLYPLSQKPAPAVSQQPALTALKTHQAGRQLTHNYPVYDRPSPQAKLERFDPNTLRLIRLHRLLIDRTLDLHDMNIEQAYQQFQRVITESYHAGQRLLLVITGKGGVEKKGVLRTALPRWCREPHFQPMIVAIHKALAQHGGDGAYYVRVRNKDKVI